MPKFVVIPESETVNQLQFFCPGCNIRHALNSTWTFNGDLDKPTVTPSILERGHSAKIGNYVCHSYITRGKIKFLPDCTHALAGQTVELPEIDENTPV